MAGYDFTIKDIIDPQVIKAIQDIITGVGQLDSEVVELQKTFSKNKNEMSANSAAIKSLSKDYQTNETAINTLILKNRALAEANKAINTQLNAHSKALIAAGSSYNELNAALNGLENRYRSLTKAEREGQIGKEMLDRLNLVKKELVEIDASMGNYRRNVGNYASGFGNLTFQVQQVVRELPAAASGLNIFFIAIANNIPMLADEIKNAKEQIDEMRKAGEKAPSVMSQITKSLFSWQTALVIGLALLARYGKDVIDWVASLFIAERQVDNIAYAQKKLNEAMSDSAKSISDNVIVLSNLASNWNKLGDNMNDKIRFLIENREALDGIQKGINSINEAEKLFSDGTGKYIQSAMARAEIDAARKLAAEAMAAVLTTREKMMEINEDDFGLSWLFPVSEKDIKIQKNLYQGAVSDEEKLVLNFLTLLENAQDKYAKLQNENLDKDKEYWETIKSNAEKTINSLDSTVIRRIREAEEEGLNIFNLGIDESQVNLYVKSLKDIEEATQNLSGYDVDKNKNKEQKKAEDAAKYQIRLANWLAKARASVLEKARMEEIAQLEATYQERESKIKGNSDKEMELRALYAEEIAQETERINQKYDDMAEKQQLQNRVQAEEKGSKEEFDARIALNEQLREMELREAERTGADRESIMLKYNEKAIEIQGDYTDELIERIESSSALLSQAESNAFNQRLRALEKQHAEGLIDDEEYESERVRISGEYAVKQVQTSVDMLKQILSTDILTTEQREQLAYELAQAEMKLSDEVAKAEHDNDLKTIESKKKRYAEIASYIEKASELLSGFGDLAGALFEADIQRIEDEEKANNEAGDKEIKRIEELEETGSISKEEAEARKRAAEDKTAAKEKELAKQKAEIQKKQAIFDKAIQLSQTGIATARGIMEALAMIPPNPVLASFIALQGALQVATILATPIPKYAKGTDYHKGGLAIVGDAGKHEGVITSHGLFITPNTPTLVDMEVGAKVIPNIDDFKGKSDLMLMMDKSYSNGAPIIINDYTRIEDKLDRVINAMRNEMSASRKQSVKIEKRHALRSQRNYIASRL
jgi:hypothetical protein